MYRFIILLMFYLFPQVSWAQELEVTAPSIYSVKVTVPGTVYGLPLITLGDRHGLVLSFDELTRDAKYYRYKLHHCDRDWNPTDLPEIEYLEGINDQLINDYSFSNQTHKEYVNYQIPFPNEDLKPKIRDRKSTRLNSSHVASSYAVFCLKKKKKYRRKT